MNVGDLALPLMCPIAAWEGTRERCLPPYPLPPVAGGRAEPEVVERERCSCLLAASAFEGVGPASLLSSTVKLVLML